MSGFRQLRSDRSLSPRRRPEEDDFVEHDTYDRFRRPVEAPFGPSVMTGTIRGAPSSVAGLARSPYETFTAITDGYPSTFSNLRTAHRPGFFSFAENVANLNNQRSPFYDSMVQAADRIAQGPVLDLAGSLDVNSAQLPGSYPHQRIEGITATAQELEDHNQLHSARATVASPLTEGPLDAGVSVNEHIQSAASRQSRRRLEVGQTSDGELVVRRARHFDQIDTTTAGNNQDGDESQTFGWGPPNVPEYPIEYSDANVAFLNRDERNPQGGSYVLAGERAPPATDAAITRVIRRSEEARRELERALNDYRMARTALRGYQSGTAAEQETADNEEDVQILGVGRRTSRNAMRFAIHEERLLGGSDRAQSESQHTADAGRTELYGMTNRAEAFTNPVTVPDAWSETRRDWTTNFSRTIRSVEERDGLTSQPQTNRMVGAFNYIGPSSNTIPPIYPSLGQFRRVSDRRQGRQSPIAPGTETRHKAKQHLRYLTELKNCEDSGSLAIALAKKFGLGSKSEGLVEEKVFDLPMQLAGLPRPQHSSFLTAGMTWSGQQSGGNMGSALWGQRPSTRHEFAREYAEAASTLLRVRRNREQMRSEGMEQERRTNSTISPAIPRPTAEDPPLRFHAAAAPLDLDDIEESLSNILADRAASSEDIWPVTVKIHSVDWEKMTVTGTMFASQIPDRTKMLYPTEILPPNEDNVETKSMESVFDGEIIDFRHHELETLKSKAGYCAGGAGVDIQYWAGVGPFKQEVDRAKEAKRIKKKARMRSMTKDMDSMLPSLAEEGYEPGRGIDDGDNDSGTSSQETDEEDTFAAHRPRPCLLDEEEEDEATDGAMIECLGSEKWIQEKLGEEWILMRWKERHFNVSLQTTSTPDASAASQTSTLTYSSSDNNSATWGLTISGFYYVALHRQTGRIESLYYDLGSQPYQRLEMMPEWYKGGDQNEDEAAILGIRREFPAIELR